MNNVLYSSTNVSSTSPCVQLYNMTTGDFHGNVTNRTRLGMVLTAPLSDFKYQLDPPSNILTTFASVSNSVQTAHFPRAPHSLGTLPTCYMQEIIQYSPLISNLACGGSLH